MLEIKNLSKKYILNKKNEVIALDNISITFNKNKFYGIKGHSGSGKSTLINIIGLIESKTSGKYLINNKDIDNLTEDEEADLRKSKIGFVFQDFFLNPRLTALENVIIPMLINDDIPKDKRNERAEKILTKLGLKDRVNHKPTELSGGEQQRVAIARALVSEAPIILADEPTGNLDNDTAGDIIKILKKLAKERNKCVIVVTHSKDVANAADIILELSNKKLKKIGKIN